MFKVIVQPQSLVDKNGRPLNFVFGSNPQDIPEGSIGIVCKEDTIESVRQAIESLQSPSIQLMVETKEGWKKLELNEIVFFESFGTEIVVHLSSKDSIIITDPLYQIEEVLNPYNFARIAKSFIVNLSKIDSIQVGWNAKLLLYVGSTSPLEVTRSFVPQFKKRLGI